MTSGETFPKKERLTKTKDFRRVRRDGAAFGKKDGEIILYRLPNGLEANRIGFSIPAKNIRLATRRNRMRRLLREVYRRTKRNLRRSFDLVLVVKRWPGDYTSYKDVEEIFLKLAKESRLL